MRNVLITGAASGIGYELAKRFLEDGKYRVFMSDCNNLEESFFKLKDETLGNKSLYKIFADVVDNLDLYSLKNYINGFGKLDILINNAGIGLNCELIKTKGWDLDRLIDINFRAPVKLIMEFFDDLKKTKGHIVNVSSGQVFFRLPSWGAYTATKSALSVVSELLAYELSKYNINVSTIYPFMVDTPFYKGVEGNTFVSKLAMKLLPLYSDTPKKVADKIFKAVEKKKKIEYVNPINYLGIAIRAFPPIANLFTYITSKMFLEAE